MVVNVELLSKEMIKPSSPTPHHLRNFKLSFLDQIVPPVYVPMILFYQAELGYDIDRAQKSQSFKKSLSTILTRFYPLAGRIMDDFSIDCNDVGVEYVEAQVHAQLSQVIKNPDMEELKQFLPIDPYGRGAAETGRDIPLAIQINFFGCGGLAISVCMSHKIADGSSLVTFINAWAATSRGASEIVSYPNFDLATRFPPRELSGFPPTAGMTKEKIVTKMFVFDKMKLDALKEACSSAHGSQVKNPSRVEAVSAFIWKKFMDVAKHKMDTTSKKMFAGVHAVNLRPRMGPPLPDHAFGNLWRFALALSTSEGDKITYQDLVAQLRCSIKKIDSNYVKKLENGDGYLEYLKKSKEQLLVGQVEFCNFSSWCRFPVYEVDFGKGTPVWVCTTTMPFKNVVILMSTRCGDGIEAWVSMLEEDMAMLEHDHKLLSLVDTNIPA